MSNYALFKEIIESGDYLVLDTETTGLGTSDRIIQIAIVNQAGETLVDSYINPGVPIPPDATRIHGIKDHDVFNAVTWSEHKAMIERLLKSRNVLIYNARYDLRMMNQSGGPSFGQSWQNICRSCCVMDRFAEFYGEWNSYRHSYTWQPLSKAASYLNQIILHPHTALGDALTTLAVAKALYERLT